MKIRDRLRKVRERLRGFFIRWSIVTGVVLVLAHLVSSVAYHCVCLALWWKYL